MPKIRERGAMTKALGAFISGATEGDHPEGGARYLSTDQCVPWRLHNRNPLWFEGAAADELRQSIVNQKQLQPGKVRERADGTGYDIIYGVRRWNACRQAGIDFQADVLPPDTPDDVCAAMMESENEQSANISEYEKALSYRAQLDAGLFEDQKALAEAYNVSPQYVSKLMIAARLQSIDWAQALVAPYVLSLSVKKATELVTRINGPEGNALEAAAAGLASTVFNNADGCIKALYNAVEGETKPNKVVLAKVGNKVAAQAQITKGVITVKIDVDKLRQHGEQQDELLKQLNNYLEGHLQPINHG